MKISIIICTLNRSHAIVKCLDSIADSLSFIAPIEAEIIVVDNASTDDTAGVVKKWAEACAFPVRLLYEPKKGLSAARNCGLRAAQGDLLLCTDDDCRMDKNYVADALRHGAADTEHVLRGGRVELGDKTDLPITIKTSPDLESWNKSQGSIKRGNIANSILGCNMAMRRAVVEKVGPFDENLGAGSDIPASEDTDFTLRAYLADIPVEYVPDMTVYHYHGRKTVHQAYALMKNYFIGNGALYAKYIFKCPDFSRQLWWDFKDAIKETLTGKNFFKPENIGFSYKSKLIFCMLGVIKYFFRTVLAL